MLAPDRRKDTSPQTMGKNMSAMKVFESTKIKLELSNPNQDWSLTLSEDKFIMEDYECARSIQATATPLVPMAPDREALFFVTVYVRPWATEVWHETGGVALKARIGKKSANPAPSFLLLGDS